MPLKRCYFFKFILKFVRRGYEKLIVCSVNNLRKDLDIAAQVVFTVYVENSFDEIHIRKTHSMSLGHG